MRHGIISFLFVVCGLMLLHGCDMVEYHPYDVDIDGPVGLTQKNIALIQEQCRGLDTIRFAQISDTQRFYDDTKDIVSDINRRPDINFVIHTGDQTDFGLAKEYKWMRRVLMGLNVPYICAIGNHDCLGTGESSYHYMYGDDNFSLNASFLHIVSLNTNAYEYDYSTDIPDFSFLKTDIGSVPDTTACTIVAMHVAPGMTLFNDNIADYFNEVTLRYPNLLFCICGHDHRFRTFYPFGEDSTLYIECASAKRRSYIIYTITRNSYSYEVVEI